MTTITVNNTILKEKLKVLVSCADNVTIPALAHIKCDIINNKMIMTSSNLSVSIRTSIDVLSSQDTSFLLNKDAIAILNKIEDEDFTLDIDESLCSITIINTIGSFKITTTKASEFIELPNIENIEKILEMPFHSLVNGLKKTIKFIGHDYTYKPTYTNLYLHKSKNLLKIVSYDGGHLLSSFNTMIPLENDIKILFPNIAFKPLITYEGTPESIVSIFTLKNENKFILQVDDYCYYILSQEGTFINYESLLPSPKIKIIFNKKDIVSALELLNITSNDYSILNIEFAETELKLKSENINFNKNGNISIPCTLTNIGDNKLEQKEINISLKKLLSIIKNNDSDIVILYLTSALHCVILKTDSDLDTTVLMTLSTPSY